jgi:hypothetical protein
LAWLSWGLAWNTLIVMEFTTYANGMMKQSSLEEVAGHMARSINELPTFMDVIEAKDLKPGMRVKCAAYRYDADTIVPMSTTGGPWQVLSNCPCSVKEHYDDWPTLFEWRQNVNFIRWDAVGDGEYRGHATYADATDLYILAP